MNESFNIDNYQSDNNDRIVTMLRSAGINQVHSMEKVLSGRMNEVYIINDELIVRLNDGKDGRTLKRENNVLKSLKGRVKAPEIVFSDFSQNQIHFDVLISKKIPGYTLAGEWAYLDDSQRRVYIMQICNELKKLHEIPLIDLLSLKYDLPWSVKFEKYIEDCFLSASKDTQIDQRIVLFLQKYFDKHKKAMRSPHQRSLIPNFIN